MQLFNTLSRKLEPVKEDNTTHSVGLYACGFTVYDYTHLGHLRKYSMDDVLVRTLRHAGFKVVFVQNVTDVGHLSSDADTGEDKLEKGAKKYNKTVWEVAREFEAYFWKSMDLMGNLRPDVSCRATEHIPAQLELVKTLEKKGFAYVIPDDGVYFDTAQLDDYGKLAGLDLEKLQEGARVEVVPGKRNPTDFALWKFERQGENRAMVWESPWHPRSFPGWHIECSAMSMQYLGEQFAIHTGGIDHIPVHHTNEIAQSEAATGKKPFVSIWVHHNFLRVEGEKMSKSLGNFFTIDDVIDRGFEPEALRLLFLTSHYRSELNFTWESLAGAQKAWERLLRSLLSWSRGESWSQNQLRNQDTLELSAKAKALQAKFWQFLEHDLATPDAVATIWEVVKSDLADDEKYYLLLDFDQGLGLGLREKQETARAQVSGVQASSADTNNFPAPIQRLLEERSRAKEAKDYSQADALRQQLERAGYVVQDTSAGQQVIQKLSKES